MNKLFSKIAGLSIGLAMAIGVGVAVGSKEAKVASAASEELAFHFQGSSLATGTTYQAWSGSVSSATTSKVSSATWQITVGNNSAQLGTNAKSGNLSKTTLGNGGFSAASGVATALSITTSTKKYSAVYCTTGMSNITKGELIFTGTNGGAITTAWLLSSTDGSKWTVESSKTSSITTGSTFTVTKSSTAKQFAFVCYWNLTNSGGLKGFEYKLYGEYEETQTITVDPTSKEAYTDESISLTTNATSASWALSNNTCGATLSAASGKSVTVSATSAGSVRVTATASGYTSPYVDLTFSERPTSPYITPEKSSTSGYTGQNETVSFSYGNLTGSLSVSSNNTSVVTVESPSYSAGEGTIQFNFVGAGSTTIKFYDGSTELASVSVSVTASSVIITGLAASDSVYIGKTLDLGSTITVTATGSYSNAVTWTSSVPANATVDSSGVVTGVKEGSTIITVASDDYPSATMSCTVTVSEAPLEYEVVFGTAEGTTGISDFSNTTIVCPEEVTLDNIQGNVYGSTTDAQVSLRFGKSGTTGSFDASISGNYYIVSVKCNLKYYGSDTTATFSVTPDGGSAISKTLTNAWADYTYDVSESQVKKVTLGTDINGKRAFLSGFTITYAAQKTLSNIALSGSYPTSFFKGDTFSHSGMVVTANYSDSTSDVVTSNATWSTPDMSTVGSKTITVSYSDAYGSASKTYTITVSYADVASVTLSQNTAEIGLNETFDYTLVTVTVSPNNANKEVTWSVSASTVGDDYFFNESGLLSGDTEGTITLKCESVADSSKYATIVVSVTGDPTADFTPASVSGYVGKSDDVAFTYGNMSDTSLISITSSNSSIAEVYGFVADAGEGLVTVNFVAAGSATLSISYNGGSTLDSITVTVSSDSVTALTWSAPTIKVYSGATTTVSDASSWNVHYTMASGDYGSLLYGEYTLKLGGSSITLPHTWDASEDGKVLSIEYGGFSSPTTSTVNVTQTLQAVMAPVEGEPTTSTLTFTEKYATGGATSSGGEKWVVESDGTESNFDSTKGIHYGTSSASVQYIKLTTDDFASGTITKVVVNASTASGVSATAGVTIGGDQFGGDPQSLSSSATNYTFTGSAAADEIIVTITKPSSATKAIYCLSVAVTYAESSGTQNIANVAGHEAAQKAVVAFAKAMNAAFDDTANCTDGVATAWETARSAYSSNIANNASLSDDEKAYAKNLIKYASAQYTDDTDNDYSYCLERAMATYEACIQKHGQTAFMSDVRPVSASSRITSLSLVNGNGNTVAIIVIISMISVAAIGGYFFFRKRKER